MNSLTSLITKYTANYQIQMIHPQHGLVELTSGVWETHPDLRAAVMETAKQLNGVATITPAGTNQLVIHYDSQVLRQNNPLTVMHLERQLRQAYRQAGY